MPCPRGVLLVFTILSSFADGDRLHPPSNMSVTSKYFLHNSEIPGYFTCDGPNVSPHLSWTASPGAQSYVLLMKDVSSFARKGERIHWIGWDIHGNEIENNARLPVEGSSDFEQTAGYRGPCPSKTEDRHHTYSIVLFALNVSTLGPTLRAWSKWKDVRKKMQPHLVAQANVKFLYKRGASMVALPAPIAQKKEGTRGNPKLSKLFSKDLLCYTCWQVVMTMDRLLTPSVFVKSDARSKREQISEIEEKLDGVCNQNHYMNHPFPPLQISRACQYMLSEFEEAGKAFMHPKGEDRMIELCMQMTGVCNGYDAEEIALLGREAATDYVDEMGRRWVRQAKCAQGYREVDGTCLQNEGDEA